VNHTEKNLSVKLKLKLKLKPCLWFINKLTFVVFISNLTVHLAFDWKLFRTSNNPTCLHTSVNLFRFIIVTTLILIGALQRCTMIGGCIILLHLVKTLRDNSKLSDSDTDDVYDIIYI
jgi:hypothetical protein